MSALERLTRTDAPAATVLIRAAVGLVFLSEGVQKFLFPADVGAGRFEKIGIPYPDLAAPFTAVFEIVCGLLVVVGAFTRLAAIPLVVVMLVAIASTKIPMLLQSGFWKMAHGSRTDFAMLLGALFLAAVGAGPWSVDGRLERSRASS
jgi:putative oxidoreductase